MGLRYIFVEDTAEVWVYRSSRSCSTLLLFAGHCCNLLATAAFFLAAVAVSWEMQAIVEGVATFGSPFIGDTS
jgi:hypothetical protein